MNQDPVRKLINKQIRYRGEISKLWNLLDKSVVDKSVTKETLADHISDLIYMVENNTMKICWGLMALDENSLERLVECESEFFPPKTAKDIEKVIAMGELYEYIESPSDLVTAAHLRHINRVEKNSGE